MVFFEPAKPDSLLAVLVKKQGYGLLGVSVSVADLKTAQRVVQEGTHTKLGIQQDGAKASFIVSPELAAGTFMEFVPQ